MQATLTNEYSGVSRVQYFLIMLILGFVYGFTFGLTGPQSTAISVATLLLFVGGFVANVVRLRNIGVSRWWAFIGFIPIVNLIFSTLLQAAQTGWIETRRLDSTGYIIVGLCATLYIVVIAEIFLLLAYNTVR